MPSTGPRRPRALLITVVVLAVLLVAADRIGLLIAEHVAGENLAASQHLSTDPDVDVGGFPFLTQLAEGHFDEVTVTAQDLPVGKGGAGLTLTRLQVRLHDVDVTRDFATVHAGTADAMATIGYAQLGSRLGIDLDYAGHGRITASKSFTVAGQKFDPSITVAPTLSGGELSFAKATVNGASSVGGQVASALTKVFDVTLPLQGIPFDVRVRSLTVGKGGLSLALVGSDLTFRKP